MTRHDIEADAQHYTQRDSQHRKREAQWRIPQRPLNLREIFHALNAGLWLGLWVNFLIIANSAAQFPVYTYLLVTGICLACAGVGATAIWWFAREYDAWRADKTTDTEEW